LFATLNMISADGTSVLLITHDFGEVTRLGGEIIQLEEGRRVKRVEVPRTPQPVALPHPGETDAPWGVIGLSVAATGLEDTIPILTGKATVAVFDDALIRSSVWLSLAGLDTEPGFKTWAQVNQFPVVPLSAARLRRYSVHLMPADRQRYGVFSSLSVADNLRLLMQDSKLIDPPLSSDRVSAIANELGVVMPTPQSPMTTLSGGNQQKVLLAGILEANPRCAILEEPVLGMDDLSRKKALTLLAKYLTQGGACVIFTCFRHNYEELPHNLKLLHEVA
jgi:ABC-type sugar transport system ATPase subunit